jgi:hypothetical protein|tara:strand:+ start:676 stop:879 length:204 start_codon:yes stop_codon:yes gene_type:complete
MISVIALLMFLGEPAVLKEHTLMPSVSKCLAKKRIAKRNSGSRVTYQCVKLKAEVIDGKIIRIAKDD